MYSLASERGSVIVFVTLIIVVLMIMVGIGLDTGQITYVRSQGQPAVDAAALAAASAIPSGDDATVQARATAFNSTNNYLGSGVNNHLTNNSVTFINYDTATGTITKVADAAGANGVRVAMEDTNPYNGSTAGAIISPVFLTPLLNLLGYSVPATTPENLSATAIIQGIAGMPIAISGCPPAGACQNVAADGKSGTRCTLFQTNANQDNSGLTTFTLGSANSNLIRMLVDNNSTCGSIPPVNIGTCINLQNGQDTAVLHEFETVYGHNGNGFTGQANPPFPEDCGLIPVVDVSVTQYNQCAPLKGWAKFCIRDSKSQGSPKWLYGDLTCNQSDFGKADTKCYVPKLVRDVKSGM
jgi:Flp pilus assembly protein TadG